MTAITQVPKSSTAPMAQGLAAFAGIVVRRVREFGRAFKNRHDAAMLASLDDRMLADIGLTRGDLRDAFSQPLWQDPTVVLTSRIRERRINRPRFTAWGVRHEVTAPSIVPAAETHPVIDVTMYR